MRSIVVCFSTALGLLHLGFLPATFAQGTTPKPAPTDYDVHEQAGTLDIGAEYMVHSFSSGEQMFLAERYLVVEVALYPVMKNDTVQVDLRQFSLRINHKTMIPAQPAANAAASLRQSQPMYQQAGRMSGSAGGGPIDVGMGQPRPVPGSPQDRRMPAPPRTPQSDPANNAGAERESVSAEDVLLRTALPEGPHRGKVSGFVYFPFTGKSSSLKSVDLVFDGATLKLK
jgi:hypothetical protein